MCDENILNAAAKRLTESAPVLPDAELMPYVQSFLNRRELFLSVVREHGSPLYFIDEPALLHRAEQFVGVFRSELSDFRAYFAVKCNNHPAIAASLARAGLGLDVSSGLELALALEAGAASIVFTGPAKTDDELRLALQHADRVSVLMDSFRELERLETLAASASRTVRAGIRLTTDEHGLWRKFGIPLYALNQFFKTAAGCSHVDLCGLHFHTSWNLDPGAQVAFIECLGDTLKAFDGTVLRRIRFLDIGGGFWPPRGEWLLETATPAGRLREAAFGPLLPSLTHFRYPAASIETFAAEIGRAVRQFIFPVIQPTIFAEPGRWIANEAMHILLTVVDRKGDDVAITDAGTNTIGWERFEHDYAPVINLTRPALEEHLTHVLGSLCTPHDVWGTAFFGEDIQPGDILLIPDQGAYTWSLRQHFIKPLPRSVVWNGTTHKVYD
mgnify:CR=1 FL=1